MSDLNAALGSKINHESMLSMHARLESAEINIGELLARTTGVASNSKIIELEKRLRVFRDQIQELKDAIENKIDYEELRNLRYDLTNATIDINELTLDIQAKPDLDFVVNITTYIEAKIIELKSETASAITNLTQRVSKLEDEVSGGFLAVAQRLDDDELNLDILQRNVSNKASSEAVADLDFRTTSIEGSIFELHNILTKKAEEGRVSAISTTVRALGNEVGNLQVEMDTKASNADLSDIYTNLTAADTILKNRTINSEVNISTLFAQIGNSMIKNNTGGDSNLLAILGATKEMGVRLEIFELSTNVTILQSKLAQDEEMIKQLQVNQTRCEQMILAFGLHQTQSDARIATLEARLARDEKQIADFQPYTIMVKELVECLGRVSNLLALKSCYEHL